DATGGGEPRPAGGAAAGALPGLAAMAGRPGPRGVLGAAHASRLKSTRLPARLAPPGNGRLHSSGIPPPRSACTVPWLCSRRRPRCSCPADLRSTQLRTALLLASTL